MSDICFCCGKPATRTCEWAWAINNEGPDKCGLPLCDHCEHDNAADDEHAPIRKGDHLKSSSVLNTLKHSEDFTD